MTSTYVGSTRQRCRHRAVTGAGLRVQKASGAKRGEPHAKGAKENRRYDDSVVNLPLLLFTTAQWPVPSQRYDQSVVWAKKSDGSAAKFYPTGLPRRSRLAVPALEV